METLAEVLDKLAGGLGRSEALQQARQEFRDKVLIRALLLRFPHLHGPDLTEILWADDADDSDALAMAEETIMLEEILSHTNQDLTPEDRKEVGTLLLAHSRREIRELGLRWLALGAVHPEDVRGPG